MNTPTQLPRLPLGALRPLAEAAAVHPGSLCSLVNRNRGMTVRRAEALAEACEKIGLDITREEWCFAKAHILKSKINDWFERKQSEVISSQIVTTG